MGLGTDAASRRGRTWLIGRALGSVVIAPIVDDRTRPVDSTGTLIARGFRRWARGPGGSASW
jgi:hypothetical protein